jgi:alkyl hydroperoxide reductase subunit D
MSGIEGIRDRIPEHAKDLSLNLGSVLTSQGSPGLSDSQIKGIALATAIASRNARFAAELEKAIAPAMESEVVTAAKAAAAIMGMNNVYYRFVHLVENEDYGRLPARLRMNVIRNPGVAKEDFELFSLAVSAVNGCGLCVSSHEKVLRSAGVTAEGVQSAARIAAVVHAVAGVLEHLDATAELSEAA